MKKLSTEKKVDEKNLEEATSVEKQLIQERLTEYIIDTTKVRMWEDVKMNYLKKK